jgi:hypothetical protein
MHDFRHGALASRIDIWQSGIEGCSTRNHENAAADPVDYMTTLARSSAPNFQGRSFDSIGDKNVANSAHDDSAHSYLPATNAYFMSVQPSGCGKRSNNRRKRLSNSAGAKSPRLIWKQLRHDFKSCPVTKRATERVFPQPVKPTLTFRPLQLVVSHPFASNKAKGWGTGGPARANEDENRKGISGCRSSPPTSISRRRTPGWTTESRALLQNARRNEFFRSPARPDSFRRRPIRPVRGGARRRPRRGPRRTR